MGQWVIGGRVATKGASVQNAENFSGVFHDDHETGFVASRYIKYHVATPLLSLQVQIKH